MRAAAIIGNDMIIPIEKARSLAGTILPQDCREETAAAFAELIHAVAAEPSPFNREVLMEAAIGEAFMRTQAYDSALETFIQKSAGKSPDGKE